jgi:type VI protein secretion system component Hcp
MTSAINTATTTERELTIDELDAVSGGSNPIVKSTRDASSVDHQEFVIMKLVDAATP